jgi:crossover junction endodeoxyribonuclease RuvC
VSHPIRILGIDPGYGRCGWGVLCVHGNQLKMEACGIIETPACQSFPDRLLHLHQQLKDIIKKHDPNETAIEQLFFAKNVKTAIDVGQARGVIVLTCAQAKKSVAEYKPNEIKLAVTGYGSADKTQIQRMVKIILGLKTVPKPDDVADALAIAICHANSRGLQIIAKK